MPKVAASRFHPEPDALKPSYLLLGSDSVAVLRVLRDLLRVAAGAEDAADIERLDAEPGVAARVAECAATPAFFSSARTIVLRRASRLTSDEAGKLAKVLADIPTHACVVVCMDPDPATDARTSERSSAAEKALVGAVEKKGVVVDCSPPEASQGRQRLIELAAERSVMLPGRVADLLWRMCNQDFAEARAQLDKLIEYASEGADISDEDVRALVTEKRQAQIFAFTDSVTDGDLGAALGHLDVLLASRSRPEEAAMQSVLPHLSRQFRLLWQARALLDRKVPVERWGDHASDPLLPREQNLGALAVRSRSVAAKYARLAKGLTYERIGWALGRIAEADAALKGMGSGTSTPEILGRLVADLCTLSSRPSGKTLAAR
ncbi:MAG: DNA polymerase III subunit delta [Fimbriimonadia bacterium]|jgi:DNA polymerase III delta subunit